MEFLKSTYNIISTTLLVVIIIVAHIFATDNYNWLKNTISDLGAQGHDRKIIMQLGFIIFGITLSIGIMLNRLSWRTTPLLIYGLCVALTGIFCTKPFVETYTYSTTQSILHSIFAQIAGVAFSMGILIQIFYSTDNHLKYIHFVFFILVIGLSATFGLMNTYQGVVQRLLYLISFIWLVFIYKI